MLHVGYMCRFAQIPVVNSPLLLNLVQWPLIFVDSRYDTCIMSPVWRLQCWKCCAPVYRVCACRGVQILGDRSPRRLHVVRWRLNICRYSVYDLLDVTFLASRICGLFLGFRKFCTPIYIYICRCVCVPPPPTHTHTQQVSRTCEPMVASLMGILWMKSPKIMTEGTYWALTEKIHTLLYSWSRCKCKTHDFDITRSTFPRS
jgi:hypothetical protein